MSSLGTKIKEALTGSGPHSSEAAQGDVDRRTPGSFPSDDVPQDSATTSHTEGHTGATPDTGLASSGSQHNKLHKPNDPRGWSDSDKVTDASGHTDSGVGVPQSGDNTLWTSRGATAPKDTTTTHHDHPSGTREGLGSTAAAAGATGVGAHQASGRHQHHDSTRPADNTAGTHTQPGDSTGSHWHTQPGGSHTTQHGTDTGAGLAGAAVTTKHEREGVSAGNQTAAAPNTQAPYWGDIPHGTGGGVYNTVTGHGSAEDDQHHHQGQHGTGALGAGQDTTHGTSGSTQQRAFPLGSTSTPHGDDTRNPHESRFREGAAGVGAGAGAGLAAHELQKKHDQRDDQRNLEKDQKYTTVDPAKEHDSKLAGLFHRGDKHEKESKHEVKEDKHKHHTDDKDRNVTGLAHRGHTDDRDLKHEEREREKHPKHTDEATAAAAAAYAAHSATDDKHKHHDDTTQPKEKKESKLGALFHRGSKDKDDEHTKEERHATKHHESAAVAAANPTTRDHTTHTTPYDTTQHQTARQPGEHVEKKHSDYAPGIAAAGAGGAAAYGAHKFGHKDDDKHQEAARSGLVQGYPATQEHPATGTQGYPATQGHSSTQGYPATQGYSTTQGSSAPQGYTAPHQSTQSGYTGSQPGYTGSQPGYTSSQPGHNDKYNVLPGGTTSGVNTSGTSGPTGYGSGSTPQTTHGTSGHSDHSGAKYGAAGAAAVGLGAAAYQSHTHDKSRDATPGQQQTQSGYPSASSNPPPAAGFSSAYPSSSPTDTRHSTTAGGLASHSPRDATSTTDTHSSAYPTTSSSGTHSSTQPTTSSSGDGKYNTLSSGTPSGVAIDDGRSTTTSQPGTQTSRHDNNYGSKAAAAGAGAAGAGTAAYLASRGGENPHEQSELHRKPVGSETQSTAAGGAPIPPVAGGGKVIHKCQKCGEDNDISHYFKR